MRGVAALWLVGRPDRQSIARAGALHINGGGARTRIGLVHQPRQWHRHKIHVAKMQRAILKAASQGLDDPMHGLRRARVGHLEAFENIQALRQRHATARGQRCSGNARTTIAKTQRFALNHPITGQIGKTPHTTGGIGTGHQCVSDTPAIKAVGALARNQLQRDGKIRLPQAHAGRRRTIIKEKNLCAITLAQKPLTHLCNARKTRINCKTVARQSDRRRQGLRQWQATVMTREMHQSRRHTGYRRRAPTTMRCRRRRPAIRAQKHRGCRRRWCRLAGVEHDLALIGGAM